MVAEIAVAVCDFTKVATEVNCATEFWTEDLTDEVISETEERTPPFIF